MAIDMTQWVSMREAAAAVDTEYEPFKLYRHRHPEAVPSRVIDRRVLIPRTWLDSAAADGFRMRAELLKRKRKGE